VAINREKREGGRERERDRERERERKRATVYNCSGTKFHILGEKQKR
jgi:hypothetical protein